MRHLSVFAAAVLLLVSFSAFGAECENPIRALGAPDGQTGALWRMSWFLDAVPQSQTITGHDFEEPVVIPSGQRAFNYVPELPGEKHLTLTVVTECGTFSRTVKYHIMQCDTVAPPITVDKASVVRGDTLTASVALLPGHTARWVVTGGTPSATEGESISIVAGSTGFVRIRVFVSRGNQNATTCEAQSVRNVPITQPCTINEPQLFTYPAIPRPNEYFTLSMNLGFQETVAFNVTNATVLGTGSNFLDLTAPASGSFTVEYTISKPGCSRTFSRTFEVTPCAPTATVTAGPKSCGSSTVAVDFTGTAPWQGYWNDGSYFFTFEPHLEREVYTAGTYTISSFVDRDCQGTVTGSVDATGALWPAVFEIDPIVNGGFYGAASCPGMVRSAALSAPVPAGAEVVWSVSNGEIVSGQGTGTLQFSGTSPGETVVSASFRTADGCASEPYAVSMTTQGLPEAAITVEPSTIDQGGTAIVKVTLLNNYMWGMTVSSSLGDTLIPTGNPDQFTYLYEYRSTVGGGTAIISAYTINACGQSNVNTATLTIIPAPPAQATATIRQSGSSCLDYVVYAELTGTAPFSGTWSTGETFTSDYPWVSLYAATPGTYTLTEFRDANGPGVVNGSATFDYEVLPAPQFTYSTTTACPNSTITATLDTPVPDGATIWWQVYGTGSIVDGQGTPTITISTGEWYVYTSVRIYGPNACSPESELKYLPVGGANVQPVYFDIYGLQEGTSATFPVWTDPSTATLSFENTLGDAMEIVDNPYPGFYTLRYTSSHGAGESTIRIFGTTSCGVPFEGTRTIQIWPAPPAPATATFTAAPSSCGGGTITVNFTGAAPFSGTWSDTGESFTTSETTLTRTYALGGFNAWIYNFRDANGWWGTTDQVSLPYSPGVAYPYTVASPYFCPGGTSGISVLDLPAGYEVLWNVGGIGRIVSGIGTTELTVTADTPGTFPVSVRLRSPEGCEGPAVTVNMTAEGPVAAPVITVPKTTLAPGESMEFDMDFAFSGLYTTLVWQYTAGNIEFVSANVEGSIKYRLRYTAPAEPGEVQIFAIAETQCGQQFNESVTVTIN